MNGTAVYGEPVVVIEVDHGEIRLKKGRVVSDGSEPLPADRARVWSEREFSTVTDPQDDAHEKEFCVDDIHLLKASEAESLKEPARAQAWFGSIYQDWLVNKIQRALKRLKL